MLVPPRAAVAPALQLDGGQVRHEVGFPHVVAGAHGDEIAVAGKIFLLAGALAEIEIAVEHKGFVVKDIHHHRQVGGAHNERALAAAAVEMPVSGIERDGEQAFRAPFETAAAAVGEFDLGRAVAFEHVNDFLVEMPLRRGRFARRNLQDEHVGEVAASLQMHRRALDAIARPRRGLDGEQIDAIVLGDRDAFPLEPIEIGIDAVSAPTLPSPACGGGWGGGLRDFADVHVLLRRRLAGGSYSRRAQYSIPFRPC